MTDYRSESERHEIYLQRLATGLLNAHIYPSLDAAIKAAQAILVDVNIKNQDQLLRVINRVTRDMSKELDSGWATTTDELVSIAIYESGYAKDLIEKYQDVALKSTPDKILKAIKENALMTLTNGQKTTSNFWEAFVKSSTDSTINAAVGEISKGFETDLANSTVISNLRGLETISRREAETLVRTGLNFYASQAREQMAILNANVITYREYNAIFDNRTTLGCRALDGKRWPSTDESYVRVPRHFNCRSFYTFGTGNIDEPREGKRQATSGKEADVNPNRKLKYRGKRDQDIFNVNQIDAGASQDEWLRSQPDWFIESSLGKTRAKLFEGGMKIEKFTDMTGQQLTLDELKKIDAKAFKRAGL